MLGMKRGAGCDTFNLIKEELSDDGAKFPNSFVYAHSHSFSPSVCNPSQ